MKRWQAYFIPFMLLSLVVATLFISGCCCSDSTCTPGSSESLPVTLHPQETRMWCWAASGQMVMDYLGHDVAQCVQANNRFGLGSCCNITLCPTPVSSHACVSGGWPEFDKYGFSFNKTSSAPLSWDDLRAQISTEANCEKKPFCFSWRWNGGGGHMMVVIGYSTAGGVNYVEYLDPWSPCVGDHYVATYSAYVSGSGYTHWNDFYDVTYTGS